MRVLQVLKLRGSGYRAGKHAYRLSPRGLDIFPRLADPVDRADYGGHPRTHVVRASPALDAMLADGYWRGASTLIAGPSGHREDPAGAAFRLRRRPTAAKPASSPRSRKTRYNSNASCTASPGRCTTPTSS